MFNKVDTVVFFGLMSEAVKGGSISRYSLGFDVEHLLSLDLVQLTNATVVLRDRDDSDVFDKFTLGTITYGANGNVSIVLIGSDHDLTISKDASGYTCELKEKGGGSGIIDAENVNWKNGDFEIKQSVFNSNIYRGFSDLFNILQNTPYLIEIAGETVESIRNMIMDAPNDQGLLFTFERYPAYVQIKNTGFKFMTFITPEDGDPYLALYEKDGRYDVLLKTCALNWVSAAEG